MSEDLNAVGAAIAPEEIGTGVLIVRGKDGLESVVLTYDQVEYIKMVLANISKPPKQVTIDELLQEFERKK